MNKQIETAPERIVLCPLIEGTTPEWNPERGYEWQDAQLDPVRQSGEFLPSNGILTTPVDRQPPNWAQVHVREVLEDE